MVIFHSYVTFYQRVIVISYPPVIKHGKPGNPPYREVSSWENHR